MRNLRKIAYGMNHGTVDVDIMRHFSIEDPTILLYNQVKGVYIMASRNISNQFTVRVGTIIVGILSLILSFGGIYSSILLSIKNEWLQYYSYLMSLYPDKLPSQFVAALYNGVEQVESIILLLIGALFVLYKPKAMKTLLFLPVVGIVLCILDYGLNCYMQYPELPRFPWLIIVCYVSAFIFGKGYKNDHIKR